MKKFYLFTVLLVCCSGFAQRNVAQKVNELFSQNANVNSYSVLNENNNIQSSATRNAVAKATYAEINLQATNTIFTNKESLIEVEIPYQGSTIVTQLFKVDIFAEGFHVDTDKAVAIPYEKGAYYRGIIKGETNSLVAFSFFKDEFNGIISSRTLNNLVIAKLDKPNNNSDYIIYSDVDLLSKNNFECKVKESFEEAPQELRSESPATTRCVTMYFEIDFNLYEANNSNTTTTTNWMTSVFNNVQTLFTNDGITTSLKSTFIWTTPDPYEGIGTSSADYLYEFNDLRPVFDGDLGQLLGIDPGGLGGVAIGTNGICTQDNFSYSDVSFSFSTVPTYSWTIMVISHEFGHLLGSPHTHGCRWNGDNTAIDGCGQSAGYSEGDCPEGPIPSSAEQGTIMSYCHLVSDVGISFVNGFGPQPAARIQSKVNAGPCLSTDCINTCINTVANITATSTTANAATISWQDLAGATNWQIAVTPFSSSTDNWVPVNTNSYTASGLTPNTYYVVRVRPTCGFGLVAPNEQTIVVTSTDYCDGIEIADTGGTTDDYTDSESYVRTIIPNLPSKKIKLTFTAFNLELDYDYLYVYDGNSTSAPDLSAGGFTGDNIPGPFVSTAADGSLTMRFYSDGGVVAPGYVAEIVCESLLSNGAFQPNIDFTYSPNPTNGIVNITSKTTISEITIYNIEGRLLYQNQVNGLDSKVDIAAFAQGTYFFKLKINNTEVHFKILKMN